MKKRIFISVLFSLTTFFIQTVSSQKLLKVHTDFYTEIATNDQNSIKTPKLEVINEVVLPSDKKIYWSNSTSNSFEPLHKISTQKEMLDSLNLLKKRYTPFLFDLAPTLKNPRLEIKITKAQFRYETEADCKDFNRLLKGYGTWKEVKIPCYHGPQGPSTAWYRAEVEISDKMLELPSLMLHFNGSDYYTDAFINGHHVGYHEGMLDEFEFNISKYAHAGKNILLVKVQNDYSMLGGEGTPRRWGNKLSASNCSGWNDPLSGWSCCPTGYGIYQDLSIVAKSSPYITDLFCRPLVKKKSC